MDDLQIVPCSMNNYISVNNVSLEIVDSSDFLISGMLNTTADLSSPLKVRTRERIVEVLIIYFKASVVVKKKVLFEWIRIPCENNMGSCDYADICAFGYPQDEPCPAHLVQNNIPCRCPFKAVSKSYVFLFVPVHYHIYFRAYTYCLQYRTR